jgi:hypothetical protein
VITTKRPLRPRRAGRADPFQRQVATDACRAELASLSEYLDGLSDRVSATDGRWAEALTTTKGEPC